MTATGLVIGCGIFLAVAVTLLALAVVRGGAMADRVEAPRVRVVERRPR